MKTILFSPLGNTDPIRYFHDGPMLNIIRNYKPDIVYLYMSKEILEKHKKDNCYVYCIERLSENLKKEIDIHIIERPELVDVHIFDFFISEFTEILNEIHNKYTDDKILLNVTSGTSAMSSALQILSVSLGFAAVPIQVSTPMNSSNPRTDDEKNADPETLWELNESNNFNDNRCCISQAYKLLNEFKKQTLKKLICLYDYSAACELAKDLSASLSPKFIELLNAANDRLKLKYGKAKMIFNKYGHKIAITDNQELCELSEYILLLWIKIKKEEYADFIRAITPAIVKLFEIYLREKCDIDISDYTSEDRKGIIRWDLNKLNGTYIYEHLNNFYNNGGLRNTFISSDALSELIQWKAKDSSAKECAGELRKIEEKIRHPAAHTIIEVTDDSIKNKTGCTSDEIINKIIGMFKLCGVNVTGDYTKSYDKMNKLIIDELSF